MLVPLLGFGSNRPAGPAEKMAVAGSGWSLARVAEALGSSEQALRLIVSILMGYPFALFQRYFLFQKETYLIHLYNVFTGLSIAYFNFGKMSFGRESY